METDDYKQKRREYYKKHKEKIYEQQKEYIKRNRKKVTESLLKRRKEVAKELKAKGQMYCYLPKTERENRMINHLCKKSGLNEIDSRKLLEENNWNIKKIKQDILFARYAA